MDRRDAIPRRDFLKGATGAGLALAAGGWMSACDASRGGRLGAIGGSGPDMAETLLVNGRIATLADTGPSFVDALAIRDGRVLATGSRAELQPRVGASTRILDLGGRTAIPGLHDSHTHPIRGGLNYNLELRWDGVASISEALERLRVQAENTPPPQWVRVVGGWSEYQFREGRMPTLDEINEAAPDTPVFILHLYDQALLNRAALRALGYDENTPTFDRGLVQRDSSGRPTGLLIAKPSALILYQTLASGPKLSPDDQANSSPDISCAS